MEKILKLADRIAKLGRWRIMIICGMLWTAYFFFVFDPVVGRGWSEDGVSVAYADAARVTRGQAGIAIGLFAILIGFAGQICDKLNPKSE